MKELGVVLVVALLVLAVLATASRLRETRRPPGPRTSAAPEGPSAPSPALTGGAPEEYTALAPTASGRGAADDVLAEEDPEAQAAIAVIDVADRVHSGELDRDAGLALVRAIGDALPRGLHRGGPPLALTDVLGEVLRSIGEVTDLSRIEDAHVVALAGLARSDAPTLRHDLATAGVTSLYDAAVALFAAWSRQGEDTGSAT